MLTLNVEALRSEHVTNLGRAIVAFLGAGDEGTNMVAVFRTGNPSAPFRARLAQAGQPDIVAIGPTYYDALGLALQEWRLRRGKIS